ncbi:MAG TPA: carboxypeptidase regulatory-like domain-containing protein, partial [Thermoanaerobaculia bacterium]
MSLRAVLLASLLAVSAAIPVRAQSLHVVGPEGKPVAGAQVIVRAPRDAKDPLSAMLPDLAEGETDASGVPPFRIPLRDHLRILIDSQDFLPVARDLAPGPGELRIPLAPGRTWRGKVAIEKEITGKGKICATWSETIPNWDQPLVWQRCADLSPRGEFELKGLGSPELDAEAQVPGYLTLRHKVALSSPGVLRPRRGILLQGRVVGPGAGSPIAQASLRSAGSAPVESERTGAFAIGVPSLPATLDVSAPGFRARKVPLKSRPQKDFVILLERGEQIRGALADEQGRAIPKAVFWVERSEEGHQRSEEQTVRTDQGAFVLDLPSPGLYRLRIRAEGFREEPLPEITVAAGESRSLGTVVVRRGLGVSGIAVDAKTGEPLAGVDVELRPEGPQLLEAVLHRQNQRTVSDAEGRFLLGGIGVGRFTLTARRSGYAPAILTTTLNGTQVEDLGTVRLEHGVLLRGKVTDREGAPRSGLTVRLFGPEPGSLTVIAERTTGTGGTFEGPAVASGRYRVQVWGGRLLLAQEIEVPGGREEWPLDLKAGGVHLTGTVTRAGEPAAGGSLSLSSKLDPADSRGKIRLSSEDAGTFTYGFPETHLAADVRDDGTFEIADVPAGALRIDYTGRDGAAVTREAQVPDEARASLTLEVGGVPLR